MESPRYEEGMNWTEPVGKEWTKSEKEVDGCELQVCKANELTVSTICKDCLRQDRQGSP